MNSRDKYMNEIPSFWKLEFNLQRRLIRDFLVYVYNCVKFKHWVMFFSFWALAFQSRILLNQYLVFDTVVKVEMLKPEIVPMPGVTVCTDRYHMVMKNKLSQRYPQILQEIKQRNLTQEKDIIQVYRRWKQIAFDNSTVDQWFSLMADPWMVLECKMTRRPVWFRLRNLTEYPDCYNMSEILYSLPMGAGICWTFFSQVNPRDYRTRDWVIENQWYDVDVELGILASFRIHYQAFYDNDFVYDDMPFSDDNPKQLPELAAVINYHKAVPPSISLDRAELRPGTNYEVMYSQTNSKLLNAPFNTDCRDYEIEVPFKSNYECIDDCLNQHMLKECKCQFRVSRGDRVTKWPAKNSYEANLTFCLEKPSDQTTNYCESSELFHRKYYNSECRLRWKCKNNCFEEYFRYEVKQLFWDIEIDEKGLPENEDDEYFYEKGGPEYNKSKEGENFATLRIRRKDEPNTTYDHAPDMIFVEFVCYFGGLLGLWLGISMLDCYNQSLVWYAEAPGEYRKWLERQKVITNVEPIRIENNGNISVIGDTNQGSDQRTESYRSLYNTQYSNTFGTQFE